MNSHEYLITAHIGNTCKRQVLNSSRTLPLAFANGKELWLNEDKLSLRDRLGNEIELGTLFLGEEGFQDFIVHSDLYFRIQKYGSLRSPLKTQEMRTLAFREALIKEIRIPVGEIQSAALVIMMVGILVFSLKLFPEIFGLSLGNSTVKPNDVANSEKIPKEIGIAPLSEELEKRLAGSGIGNGAPVGDLQRKTESGSGALAPNTASTELLPGQFQGSGTTAMLSPKLEVSKPAREQKALARALKLSAVSEDLKPGPGFKAGSGTGQERHSIRMGSAGGSQSLPVGSESGRGFRHSAPNLASLAMGLPMTSPFDRMSGNRYGKEGPGDEGGFGGREGGKGAIAQTTAAFWRAGGGGNGKSIVKLAVEGSDCSVSEVEKDRIASFIQNRLSQVRRCYEMSMRQQDHFSGRLLMHLQIEGNGKPTGLRFESPNTINSDLNECLTERVAEWRFPRPANHQALAIAYPFVFATSEEK